jgi:hypothetical protein
MYKILLKWILILNAINLIYGSTFYVSPAGSDASSCTTLNNPCKTVDHVLMDFVNGTSGNHKLYVEFGTYIFTHGNAFDSDDASYVKFVLYMTGNVDSSSLVDPDDITIYPIIEADVTDSKHDVAFHCGLNVQVQFHYLLFTTEIKDHGRLFQSFQHLFNIFLLIVYFIYLFLS